MREELSEIFRYRQLLTMMAWRDIRIRYKQSVMGFLWAIFMPLVIVAAGIVIRKAFSILSNQPLTLGQIASVSVKSLPWAFFVGAIRFATNSLTGNMNLVTKIYFPREVFPLAAVLTQLVDFAVATGVLVIILAIGQVFEGTVFASLQLLWLPVLLLLLVMLTCALSLFLSMANLFFRDVKYIVEVVLTVGIFFTPVFYEASMFGSYQWLLLLNPVAPILEGINNVVVLRQAPDLLWLAYSAVWAAPGLLLAWHGFHKAEFAFAENI